MSDHTQMHQPPFLPGRVIDNRDPEKSGRLRVRVPQAYGDPSLSDGEILDEQLPWALPCFPVPGVGDGEYHVPSVGAQVWVGWYGGQREYPIWFGGAVPTSELPSDFSSSYGAGSPPPHGPQTRFTQTEEGQVFEMRWVNGEKKIRLEMPNGVKIEMLQDTTSGGPRIEMVTPSGYQVLIDELGTDGQPAKGPRASISTPTQMVELLEATQTINIQTPGQVTVTAGLAATVTAQGITLTSTGAAPVATTGGGVESKTFAGAATHQYSAFSLTTTVGALALTALTTLALVAGANISIFTAGVVAVGTVLGVKLSLVNANMIAAFNAHTHTGVTPGGGSTGTPSTAIAPGAPVPFDQDQILTTRLTAE